MYITYHEEIERPEGVDNNMPHMALNTDIRNYLEERGVAKRSYYTKMNGYYLFIYLFNGDRIDVKL